METVALFSSIVETHNFLGYAVLFFGMILEGEVVLMAAGILAHIGAFSLGKTFVVAYLGMLVNDIFWYYLGAHVKANYYESRLIKNAEAKANGLLPYIRRNPGKAIYLSKFIAGLNHPTLILLGFLRIDFKYFLEKQILASFLWTTAFLSIGYIFGYTAINFSHRLREFIFAAILLLIIAMLVDRIVRLKIQRPKEEKIKT